MSQKTHSRAHQKMSFSFWRMEDIFLRVAMKANLFLLVQPAQDITEEIV
jgi:hypothetical protein